MKKRKLLKRIQQLENRTDNHGRRLINMEVRIPQQEGSSVTARGSDGTRFVATVNSFDSLLQSHSDITPAMYHGINPSIPSGPAPEPKDAWSVLENLTGSVNARTCETGKCLIPVESSPSQPADELGDAISDMVAYARGLAERLKSISYGEKAALENYAANLSQAYEAHKQSEYEQVARSGDLIARHERRIVELEAVNLELRVSQLGRCPNDRKRLRYGDGLPDGFTQLLCPACGEVGKIKRVFKIGPSFMAQAAAVGEGEK